MKLNLALAFVPVLALGCAATVDDGDPADADGPTGSVASELCASKSPFKATRASDGDLAGAWRSPAAPYDRTITFDAATRTVSVHDSVAPCPPGTVCVWSGIVEARGRYTIRGSVVAVSYDSSPGEAWGLTYPAELAHEVQCRTTARLRELQTDGRLYHR